MRRIGLILTVLIIALPMVALAHGGFEKSAGNLTFFMIQNPVSPLVGEQVNINVVVAQKADALKRLVNTPVHLRLIDTYYGDESKDKVILTRDVTTDANGSFDFSYTFPKENYFDVELTVTDLISGEEDTTGFLIQPRAAVINKIYSSSIIIILLVIIFISILPRLLAKTK